MAELRIRVLGAPQVERSGQPVPFQRRKIIALLAYLCVTGQPHSRDSLAALLWPEFDQTAARANLRRDLSRLKDTLGGQTLDIEREQVGLKDGAEIWLDAAEFSRRFEQTRAHGHSPRSSSTPLCDECHAALTEAVQLYRGDFLEGFSLPDSAVFDEWQFFQTETLRQRLAEALQMLVRWHSLHSRYKDSIALCRRWLALDSLHEPAHRLLMQLYAWDGQHSAALRQFQECQRLLQADLGVEPEAETMRLYEAIRARKLALPESAPSRPEPEAAPAPVSPLPASPPRNNLPVQPTRFVGRQEELSEIHRLLLEDPACQLLTLLGPGGSGKTRLALQAAQEACCDHFSDGVWFIPLAPMNASDAIPAAIARALDLSLSPGQGQPARQLVENLRQRHLLLVLDNFEHLIDPASLDLVLSILSAAPRVKLLVTSRARLNARGEHLLPVSGLRIPPEDTTLAELEPAAEHRAYSAIELFQQSARRVLPDFNLTEENLKTVMQVCRLVQGMPLGIELAAAWLEMLPLDEIRTEVERSLDFLEADWHDLPERQRSLRAVFDASWSLLSPQERPALKALVVFPAGFTRQAAQTVAGASPKMLLGLINKSWVQRHDDGRYLIHEMLRQYGREKLDADPITSRQVYNLYGSYYTSLLENLAQEMRSPRQHLAFEELAVEFENIRLAWKWMVEQGDVRTAVEHMLLAIFLYCESSDKVPDLRSLLDQARQAMLAASADQQDPTLLEITWTAQSAFYTNNFSVRSETFGYMSSPDIQGVTLAWQYAQQAHPNRQPGYWDVKLAYQYGRMVDLKAGIQRLRGLIEQFRTESRLWELAFSLEEFTALYLTGEKDERGNQQADRDLAEAYQIFQSLGDRREAGLALRQHGNLRYQERRLLETIPFWQEAQKHLQAAGEWTWAGDIYWQIGDVYIQIGQYEDALRCYRQVSEIDLARGNKRLAAAALSKESYEAVRYGDLEQARRTRLRSLALAREVNEAWLEAWCTWEMGELLRVTGDMDDARFWFDRAAELFEQTQDMDGTGFYHRGLGDIALDGGDFITAQQEFGLSLEIARRNNHEWAIAYALAGLARACTGLAELTQARRHLTEALSWGQKLQERGVTLLALAALADWHAANGDAIRAVELAAQAEHHLASWRTIRKQAASRLAALAAELPPQESQAAQERGRQLDLWETVSQARLAGG